MIVFTGVLGTYLARRQGFMIVKEIRSRLHSGEMPGDTVLDGIFVFVGGILLLAPGYVTDVVGFVFLFPVTRKPFKSMLMKWFEWKLRRNTIIVQR